MAGCAFDDHGRGHFSGRGGSLKDTHLQNKAAYKSASYRRKNRSVSYRPAKIKKKRIRIARLQKKTVVKQVPHTRKLDNVLNTQKSSDKEPSDTVKPEQIQEKDKEKNMQIKEAEQASESESKDTPANSSETRKITLESAQKERKPETNTRTENNINIEKNTEKQQSPELAEVKKEDKKQLLAMHIDRADKDIKQPAKRTALNADILGEGEKAFAVVKVHYATDRNLSGQSSPRKVYGIKRSSISYGTCEISIPRNHKMGEIEAPSIWRLEFSSSSKKHVVLKNVNRRSKTRFFQDVRNNVKLSHGKNAFIFIHGYNIEFHEAAKRTAQIAYDLRFDGAPIFYSWPSRGGYKDYTRDEANVRWTQSNLKRFLKDFVKRSDAKNIYLIAHSMGARALTGAVAELVTEMPSVRKRFKEVLLAAPDIDAEVFKRDIAPKLVKAARNVTLYASADDRALQWSRAIHGEPRAGDAGNNLVVVKGVDTIDATGIDTSLFGHAYFAEVPTIITDMLALIRYGRRPKDRPGLQPVLASGGQYWAFRKNKTIIINGTTVPDDVTRTMEH